MSENTKVESRRDFLKKMSKWSKIALGTAVGVATLGSAACVYDDYCDLSYYCDSIGEDYFEDWACDYYCNYTNYPDYLDWA